MPKTGTCLCRRQPPTTNRFKLLDRDLRSSIHAVARAAHKLDKLGLRESTIVIFAGDNGRDTSFVAPGNRNAPGPWRGGYFLTYKGSNRTAQSAFVTGKQQHSNRNYFPMFFDHLHVGMRYKNFKVLTHKIADGAAPIQQLAIPHIQNLTVNPDEDSPLL
jgi:hypothetical protein